MPTELEDLKIRAERGKARASAQFNLGYMYAYGRGVAKDEAKACYWYELAAKQGNASAQSNLGYMYANGRGVAKDEAKACYWYELAAKQGNASAQFNLGFMYQTGRGVPQAVAISTPARRYSDAPPSAAAGGAGAAQSLHAVAVSTPAPKVPNVVKRSMFVEECIRIAGSKLDIYNTLKERRNSINTKSASSRDFMVLLGDYCIETTADIRESGNYLYHPRGPEELQDPVKNLLERYESGKIKGAVNFYVPLCIGSSPGVDGHWSLLKLEINNGLIQSIEHFDAAGEKPEVKYYTNKRECLEGLRLYFKDYDLSLFADNCYAKQVLYAEQRGEDRFSCLDRMIINLLRARAKDIAGPTSYNLSYGAYSGVAGATELRAITAQLMQNCINRNVGCTLTSLEQSSLRSGINSSFVRHGLPLIGGIFRYRVLQTSSYQPLGPCVTESVHSTVSPRKSQLDF